MGRTTSNEYLPCILTEDELREHSAALAHSVIAISEIDEEKKAANAEYNERKKELQASVDSLAEIVKTKRENRSVECSWRPNRAAMKWEIFRDDTGEKVREEKMTAEDLQMKLPGESGRVMELAK